MPSEIVQAKTYVKTFLCLMGLLAVTVGANFIDLGRFGIVVALGVSVMKAGLIILFFMEVRYSRPIVWLYAAAGFVWLLILLVLSMSDYATRGWTAPDWQRETNGVNHIEFARPGEGRR